jgi:hypothetical protein
MPKSTQQVPIRQASSIGAPYSTVPEPIPYQYTGRCHHRQHQYRSDERYVKQVQRDYLKGGSHPEEEFSTLNQKPDHLSYAWDFASKTNGPDHAMGHRAQQGEHGAKRPAAACQSMDMYDHMIVPLVVMRP